MESGSDDDWNPDSDVIHQKTIFQPKIVNFTSNNQFYLQIMFLDEKIKEIEK